MSEKGYVSRHLTSNFNEARNSDNWLKGLLIWTAFLLLLGCLICFLFYRYAAIYEVTRPELVMDELLRSFSEDDFLEKARENIKLDINSFEDERALFDEYYRNAARTGIMTYRKELSSSNQENTVFVVRDGIHNICKISLIPTEEHVGFGRHKWMVGEISAANFLQSLAWTEVIIDAPRSSEIIVNGHSVSEAYITDQSISCPIRDSIEQKIKQSGAFVRYSLGRFYGSISVEDKNGEALSVAADSSDNCMRFVERNSAKNSVYVSAPEDVAISIGGYGLQKSDAASYSKGIFANISESLNCFVYDTYVYSFDSLYSQPEITALDSSGNHLTPIVTSDGKYLFFHVNDEELQNERQLDVEKFFEAYTAYCSTKFDYTLYQKIINRVARHSPLYEYFENSYDVMQWATSTKTEYKELIFDNFSYVSDDCFVCTVQYQADLTSTSWYEEYSYDVENIYEIVFISVDGKWLASDMISLLGS